MPVSAKPSSPDTSTNPPLPPCGPPRAVIVPGHPRGRCSTARPARRHPSRWRRRAIVAPDSTTVFFAGRCARRDRRAARERARGWSPSPRSRRPPRPDALIGGARCHPHRVARRERPICPPLMPAAWPSGRDGRPSTDDRTADAVDGDGAGLAADAVAPGSCRRRTPGSARSRRPPRRSAAPCRHRRDHAGVGHQRGHRRRPRPTGAFFTGRSRRSTPARRRRGPAWRLRRPPAPRGPAWR